MEIFRSISLSGYAGSGKDAVADVLCSEFGFVRCSFAGPLKRIAREQFGWDGEKDDRGRRLLQVLGTEAGREYDPDIWVKHLLKEVAPSGCVVTDCRFPNELDALRGAGFTCLRVWRSGVGPANAHPSETALDSHAGGFDLFDGHIYNDGSLEDLARSVRSLAQGMRLVG